MQQQQQYDSGATSNVGEIISVVVVEQETYFFRYTFPIYRALAVFVLYVGILGINELIFNEYKINYQKLLNIDFSIKPKRVIRKVLVFLFIFFVFFIWYQLEIDILDESDQISKVFDAIEKEYLGIVLWILCIAYFLFVGRQTCLWAAHTFLQSLLSPFRPSTVPFQLGFATDQIVSLVGPLKDAEYTLCYYSSDYQSVDQLNQCKKTPVLLYIAFFPLLLRMGQCLRNCYQKRDYKGPDMLNMIKYFLSVLVVYYSHVAAGNQKYLDIWIFFAVISTVYSYAWDIKKDWNLGDTRHGFLREKIIYKKPHLYYSAMALNFGLRCMWVFTISGGVVNHFDIKRESFKFLIYLLEVIRRCIWNLLRMENEQINQKLDQHFNFIFTPGNKSVNHESIRSSIEMSLLNFHSKTSSMKSSLLLQSDIC
ncbi:EXS family protein (macronuclear) [Tetrahymena thermophila SB210]|uniref:EXS family protein n=1 Tax=Tetrahymena thermophila (strain SB210) TaxID=312017 RepID=Q22UN7_TETTS|nr:EXS family protein [Tetrahymena thermophila SB210]EAR88933.2 EXS family protein [Tetrahymena thermophila SB210]|eukprot:XP_001009178.2 EXS family protein [Tetrahymena thermophila SB210]